MEDDHVVAAPIRARYHRRRGQKVPRRGVFCQHRSYISRVSRSGSLRKRKARQVYASLACLVYEYKMR